MWQVDGVEDMEALLKDGASKLARFPQHYGNWTGFIEIDCYQLPFFYNCENCSGNLVNEWVYQDNWRCSDRNNTTDAFNLVLSLEVGSPRG